MAPLRFEEGVALPAGKLVEHVFERIEVLIGRAVDAAAIGEGEGALPARLPAERKRGEEVEVAAAVVLARRAVRAAQIAVRTGIFAAQPHLERRTASQRTVVLEVGGQQLLLIEEAARLRRVELLTRRGDRREPVVVVGPHPRILHPRVQGAAPQAVLLRITESQDVDGAAVHRAIEVVGKDDARRVFVTVGLQAAGASVEEGVVDVERIVLALARRIGVEEGSAVAVALLAVVVVRGAKERFDVERRGVPHRGGRAGPTGAEERVDIDPCTERMVLRGAVLHPDVARDGAPPVLVVGRTQVVGPVLDAVHAVVEPRTAERMAVVGVETHPAGIAAEREFGVLPPVVPDRKAVVEREGEAVGTSPALDVDVDDAGRPFGVVLRRRVAHHLHGRNRRGGHRAQHGGQLLALHVGLLAVEHHQHSGTAAERDFVLAADHHAGGLFQRVERRTARQRGAVAGRIDHAPLLDTQRCVGILGHDHHVVDTDGRPFEAQLPDVGRPLHVERFADIGGKTQAADEKTHAARGRKRKTPLVVGHGVLQHRLRVGGKGCDHSRRHGSEQRVNHAPGEREGLLGQRCKRSEQGREKRQQTDGFMHHVNGFLHLTLTKIEILRGRKFFTSFFEKNLQNTAGSCSRRRFRMSICEARHSENREK